MWRAAELSWLCEPVLSLRESLFISCFAAVTLDEFTVTHIQHEYSSNATTWFYLLSMVQTDLCNLHFWVDPYMFSGWQIQYAKILVRPMRAPYYALILLVDIIGCLWVPARDWVVEDTQLSWKSSMFGRWRSISSSRVSLSLWRF